jgi:hypothetical protein
MLTAILLFAAYKFFEKDELFSMMILIMCIISLVVDAWLLSLLAVR